MSAAKIQSSLARIYRWVLSFAAVLCGASRLALLLLAAFRGFLQAGTFFIFQNYTVRYDLRARPPRFLNATIPFCKKTPARFSLPGFLSPPTTPEGWESIIQALALVSKRPVYCPLVLFLFTLFEVTDVKRFPLETLHTPFS